jgi:hypothetical protein
MSIYNVVAVTYLTCYEVIDRESEQAHIYLQIKTYNGDLLFHYAYDMHTMMDHSRCNYIEEMPVSVKHAEKT